MFLIYIALLQATSSQSTERDTALRAWFQCVNQQSAILAKTSDSADVVASGVLGSCTGPETAVQLTVRAQAAQIFGKDILRAQEGERTTMAEIRGQMREHAIAVVLHLRAAATSPAPR